MTVEESSPSTMVLAKSSLKAEQQVNKEKLIHMNVSLKVK